MTVIALEKDILDRFFQLVAIFPPPLYSSEARVVQQLGLFDHLAAKDFPVRGAGNGKIHIFSVTGKIRTIRSDVVVAHSYARGLFACMPIVMRKVT